MIGLVESGILNKTMTCAVTILKNVSNFQCCDGDIGFLASNLRRVIVLYSLH